MLCSIVIPAFNARGTIAEALDSALSQDVRDIEVIVVDDRSTDDTLEIAKAVAAKDARLRVLQAPVNGGPGAARNIGYDAAQGDWIAVLDADDAFDAVRIRTLTTEGSAAGADLVADNLRIRSEDEGLRDQAVFSTGRLRRGRLSGPDFIRGNISTAVAAEPSYGLLKPLIRRPFVQAHGLRYPGLRFAEDFIFYTRCFAAGANLHVVPDAYYHYRVHSGSLTFSSRLDDIAHLIAEEDALLRSGALSGHPPLAAALSDHLRSVKRGYAWRMFAESAKAGHLARSAALLATRPALAAQAFSAAWRKVRSKTPSTDVDAGGGALERAYATRRREGETVARPVDGGRT